MEASLFESRGVDRYYFAMQAIFPVEQGCEGDNDPIVTARGIVVEVE